MYKFADLVQRCILRLSQQTGTAVQVYSEDIVAEMMQHKFAMVFEERFWEDYWFWFTATLTAQGVVQEDLSSSTGADIDRYTDIQCIFYDNDQNSLPRIHQRTNPQTFANRHGRPYYHEPWGEVGKFFRVLPAGSEQSVHIGYRKRPDPFQPDDYLKMDDHLLILGTAYDYLEDDGTNPGATAKFLNMYNARYEQVMASVNEQPVPLRGTGATNTSPWGVGDHTN